MNISPINDIRLSATVVGTVVLTVVIAGDAMYVGLWNYFAVPLPAFAIAFPFKPIPFFHFGVSVGLALTFYSYLCINYFSERPEGLLGLGHVFSLPGAALGIILAAYLLKGLSNKTAIIAFLIGLTGVLPGFFINQLIVCNILMWCGSLSVPVKNG